MLLSTDAVLLRTGARAAEQGIANVYFALLPRPAVEVQVTLSGIAQDIGPVGEALTDGLASISFRDRDVETTVRPTRGNTGAGPHLVGTHSGVPITTGSGSELQRVEFSVLNFPDFLTPLGTPGGPDDAVIQSVCLDAGGWRVRLDAAPGITNAVRTLQSTGGFGLTHAGCVVRADGALFTSEAALDVLASLHYFLAFASGRWTPPLLPAGYDAAGAQVWEQWQAPSSTAWRSTTTWFDQHTGTQLAHVYPGFFRLWTNPLWSLPLRKAIHWYVSTCMGDGGLDGALVLSFTALELLAWVTLVEDRHRLSPAEFNEHHATGVVRLLLQELGIPTAVPPSVGVCIDELAVLAAGPGEAWDGPKALAQVRNGIVHPKRRGRAASASVAARVEAFSLSAWYLELAVLRLCEHHGTYANRLAPSRYVGEVAPVPWAPQPSPPP